MTGTSTTPSPLVPRLVVGAGALLLMIIASIVGLLIGPEARVDSGDLVFMALEVAAGVIVWAVVLLLAREPDAGNRAAAGSVVVGVLGMAGVVVFWFGVSLVLGIGSVLLGRLGAERADHGAGRGTLARVGLVCGVLAILLWLAAFAFVQEW